MTSDDIYDNPDLRNNALAKRAATAVREWNIHNHKGKEAIKSQQLAVVVYGQALLDIRNLHSSDRKYNEEVLAQRLNKAPFDDRRHRTAALAIARLVTAHAVTITIEHLFADCPSGNAPHMLKWARKTGLIPRKKRNSEQTRKAREQIRVVVENGQPVNRDEVSRTTGLSNGGVGRAHAMEQARLEGIAEGEALALNAQGKFTKAQAKHVEALNKKLQRDLNSQFEIAVEAEVKKRTKAKQEALDSARAACVKQREGAFKDQQHWRQLINNHKPPLTLEEYRVVVIALHPDNSASEETRARALQSVTDKKLQLTGKA
jgi:hypothetical protein